MLHHQGSADSVFDILPKGPVAYPYFIYVLVVYTYYTLRDA